MESSGKVRKMTGVSSLVNNFREALLALLPWLEKSGIGWKELENYDIFDSICESLLELIVLPKIEAFMEKKYQFVPPLPKYGFFYKDYSKTSYIEVIPEKVEFTKGIYTFVYFKSENEPFDIVVSNIIDEKGNVIRRDYEIPYDECTFRFRYKTTVHDIILS